MMILLKITDNNYYLLLIIFFLQSIYLYSTWIISNSHQNDYDKNNENNINNNFKE